MADIDDMVIANRYRLVRALGEGGMGRVWAARDEMLGRNVALKEVVLEHGLTPEQMDEARQRAIREARSIAQIEHPSVVGIFDVVTDNGSPWIVMELVDSRSLFEAVEDDGPMSPQEAARVGLSVLAGLRAAHGAGVLHRDVKPANVLLATDGRIVLTDFGLATANGDSGLTSSGVLVGSPSYLAPERALDQEASAASDLWSLGATLYTAVEGRPPYEKSSPVATLVALATEPPRAMRRAGVLGPALVALLAKDPAERADAETAEWLLQAAAEGRETAGAISMGEKDYSTKTEPDRRGGVASRATAASTVEFKLGGRRRRRRWVMAGGALLIVAVAVLPALTGVLADGGSPAPSAAAEPSASAEVVVLPSVTATADPAVATPHVSESRAMPKPQVAGRQIKSMHTGTCLQLNTATGAIELWRCDGRGEQKFDLRADRTLRVLGLCVQIEGTYSGALLGTGECTGELAQQFDYNASYDLVNLQVIKCADVTDWSGGNGVLAQVWECSGNANQKWWH